MSKSTRTSSISDAQHNDIEHSDIEHSDNAAYAAADGGDDSFSFGALEGNVPTASGNESAARAGHTRWSCLARPINSDCRRTIGGAVKPSDARHISPGRFFPRHAFVRHPEYGLGKVVALSGAGLRRTATVAFIAGAGQKKFVVSQSNLMPAKAT